VPTVPVAAYQCDLGQEGKPLFSPLYTQWGPYQL
jgi:hypothetical protein